MRIGKDLHVIAARDAEAIDAAELPITRYDDHIEDIGIIGAEALLWRIQNPTLPPITQLVAPRIQYPNAAFVRS